MSEYRCTNAPLSWLIMEQYQLGELEPSEKISVDRHLESCEACSGCMDSIINDSRHLRPLPHVEVEGVPNWLGFFENRTLALGGAMAVLMLALFLIWPDSTEEARFPESKISYKGGELSISLVRKRGDSVLHDPEGFSENDRFAVQITCPPGERSMEVVFFQGGEVYFPYEGPGEVDCSNRVSLPGAFRLDGDEEVRICAIVEQIPERGELEQEGVAVLPESTVCISLKPLD